MTAVFTDPDRYTDMSAWHREVERLRSRGPVHRVTAAGFDPFWAVLTHEAVMEVERRPDDAHRDHRRRRRRHADRGR